MRKERRYKSGSIEETMKLIAVQEKYALSFVEGGKRGAEISRKLEL